MAGISPAPKPAATSSLNRRDVARAKDDGGLHAGRPDALEGTRGRGAVLRRDQRQRAQVVRRRRAPGSHQGRVRAHDERERLVEQLRPDERARRQGQHREREVEVTEPQGLQRVGHTRVLLDEKRNARRSVLELRHDVRENGATHARERSDTQSRAVQGESRDVRVRGPQVVVDRSRMLHDHGADSRERDSLPHAAVDDTVSDGALERRHLLAHSRLGVTETARGTPEGRLLRHGLEREEVAQLDPGPAPAAGLTHCAPPAVRLVPLGLLTSACVSKFVTR